MRRNDTGITRRWVSKFAEAFRGVWLVAKYESSFQVHAAAGIAVIALAVVFRCEALEWCLLLGCIGMVMTAEAMNAAMETLFHALDEPTKQRMAGCLDRAAGAVLLASASAAAIGAIIFLRRCFGY